MHIAKYRFRILKYIEGAHMALFEVLLVSRITSGAVCLMEKESSSFPAFMLAEGETWQNALQNFVRQTLGEARLRFRLVEVKSVPGDPPVLEIHTECTLEAGSPPLPLDERYHWVQQEKAPKAAGSRIMKRTGKLDPDREVELYTDGASRGNPGPAGIGVVLQQKESGYEEEYCRFIGNTTNNTAEYTALVEGLVLAVERGTRKVVHLTDSELLARQLSGEYKVKSDSLKMLLYQAKDIIVTLETFSTNHISRELNSRADDLADRAIIEAESS
jgi:ribonuclease HI